MAGPKKKSDDQLKDPVVLFNESLNNQNAGYGLHHCTRKQYENAKTQNPNHEEEWQVLDSFDTETEATDFVDTKREENIADFKAAEKKRIASENKK